MKPVLILIVLTLLNLAPRLAGQDAVHPDPFQKEVIVTGEADDQLASLADKIAAARLSACKLALMEVAPVLVHTRSLANANTLVANYQYVQVQGFIDRAVAIDSGKSANNVFLQRYRITVNTADFNLELIKQKIDVKFIYDLVNRPKICLAVDSASNGVIQRYFRKMHNGFNFIDLTLLRASGREEPDYVREAQKKSFDVLVIGETVRRELPPIVKAHSPGTLELPRNSPLIMLNWRAVNVHDQSIICSVADSKRDDSSLVNTDENETVVGQAAAQLFRELMSAWNLAARREKSIRLSFEHFGTADPELLVTKLSAIAGLKRDTIRQENFTKTRIDFLAAPTLSLPEITSALQRAFANEFKVTSVNDDQIVLTLTKAKSTNITLTVNGVGTVELRAIEAKLKQIEGVTSVERVSFSGGVAKVSIQTHQSPEDISVALEEGFERRLKTQGLTDTALEMSF